MERRTIAVLTLVVMLVGTGCPSQHPVRARGTVSTVTPADSADERPGAERISGARVELRCPEEEPIVLGETDEEGRFSDRRDEPVEYDCELAISRQGYVSRIYSMDEVCATAETEHQPDCPHIGVTARLVPEEAN